MKERAIDVIRITVTPGRGALTALYGATHKDGVEYVHSVYINDEYIWSDGVYLSDFEKMLTTPGDYWPFCCSYCGIPEDVNIFSPVRCRHKGDLLVLLIRRPLQDKCLTCSNQEGCSFLENGAEYDCPQFRSRFRAYCIKKEQLRQQLDELKKEFGDSLDKC